jgi:hypothetical protein
MPDPELLEAFIAFLPYAEGGKELLARLDEEKKMQLQRALPALKTRAKTLVELQAAARFIFAERPLEVDERARKVLDEEAFTYDPGFTSTASCESKITFIDGDEGILLYRGYPIEQLAEHGDFMETCYLLLYGELPTAPSARRLRVRHHLPHHDQRADEPVLHRLPPRRPSDGGHGGVVGAMSAFYHDSTDITDPHQRMVASIGA